MYGAVHSYEKVATDEEGLLQDESLSDASPRPSSSGTLRPSQYSERSGWSLPQKSLPLMVIACLINVMFLCGNFGVFFTTIVQNARLTKRCPDVLPC